MPEERFPERFEDAPLEVRELVQHIAARYYGGNVHALWRTIAPAVAAEHKREAAAPTAPPDGPLPRPW